MGRCKVLTISVISNDGVEGLKDQPIKSINPFYVINDYPFHCNVDIKEILFNKFLKIYMIISDILAT